MNEKILSWKDFSNLLPAFASEFKINEKYQDAIQRIARKIIVLDDDPTGIQTVHSIPVYTSWDLLTLEKILKDKHRLIYILTNSRALTSQKTKKLHQQLIKDLMQVSMEEKKDFLIISRSDSTLRGHYPLETRVIYDGMKKDKKIDGEIIIPFFFEGGRFTFNDIHYVREREFLIPAGQTEFARDNVFGYKASNLKDWIEEKTDKLFSAEQVKSISLKMIRRQDIKKILNILSSMKNFDKIIVNAVEYDDLKIFSVALSESVLKGKNFIFRTAASFVQVIGGIKPKPLLTHQDLYKGAKPDSPGLILIGSYVQKTNQQMKKLEELSNLFWIEWNINQVFTQNTFNIEVKRVISEIEKGINDGKDVCVYTTRVSAKIKHQRIPDEKYLNFSSRISEGLTKVMIGLTIKPSFIVAKGGITSSDIGVKGLNVKKAMVMGQIQPGIPVWRLGNESRFPDLPYVIFPGNVGQEDTLKKTLEILRGKQ